jgi:hypothetical protein
MKWRTGIAIVAAASTSAGSVAAQAARDEREMRIRQRAPHQATELNIELGYTQGFGSVGTAQKGKLGDVAGAGVGVGLGVGYRATPHASVGFSGQFQEFNAGSSKGKARGATMGVEASYHMLPFNYLDPWAAGGVGYRLLWDLPEGPNNDRLLHGVELAKLKIGLDVRASKDIALGPVVGADLSMFLFNNPEGPAGNAMLTPRVSTFVYGGLQGRFDIGGRRVLETPRAQSARWP